MDLNDSQDLIIIIIMIIIIIIINSVGALENRLFALSSKAHTLKHTIVGSMESIIAEEFGVGTLVIHMLCFCKQSLFITYI